MEKKILKVGDIVRIKGADNSNLTFLNEPKNTLGYIYEVYNPSGPFRGVSVITENGKDLQGFSESEQDEFLVYVSTIDFIYDYHNIHQLEMDFKNDVFKPFLEEVAEIKAIK